MSRQRSQVFRAQFLNLLEHEKDKTISLLCHLTLGANELSKQIKSLKFSQANRILRGCINRIKRIDSLVYQMFNVIPTDNQAKALRQVNRVYLLLQAEQRKLQIPKQAVYQKERKLFLNLKDWGRSLKHTQNTIKAWIQQFSNTVIPQYLQNQEEKTLENIEFVQLQSPGVRKYKRQVNQGVKYEGLFAGVYYFFKNLISLFVLTYEYFRFCYKIIKSIKTNNRLNQILKMKEKYFYELIKIYQIINVQYQFYNTYISKDQ